MEGNNSLELSQAAMQEAIQEYLDHRWKIRQGTVTKVEGLRSGVGSEKRFKVSLEQTQPIVIIEAPKP